MVRVIAARGYLEHGGEHGLDTFRFDGAVLVTKALGKFGMVLVVYLQENGWCQKFKMLYFTS